MKKTYVLDSFKECEVKGWHWFNPNHHPTAIVMISHGMAETIDRYDQVADYFVARNVFVYGHNHRGHGEQAVRLATLGDMGENGWIKAREDLRQVICMAREAYPGVPVFFLGHSMGSFLIRDLVHQMMCMKKRRTNRGHRYSAEDQWRPSGIILSGTGFLTSLILQVGTFIAGAEMKWQGPLHPSERIKKMSFGQYNKRIKNPNYSFDWLSRDEKEVKAYMEDPYCGQTHTSRFYWDFFRNLKRILYQEHQIDGKGLPMLLISGEEDPVGDYGEAVLKTKAFYDSKGFIVEVALYPEARHEVLHEVNRSEVYEKIVEWMFATL